MATGVTRGLQTVRQSSKRMKRDTTESQPESGADDSEIMKAHEVADYLHCHYFTVHRLLMKRAISAFRLRRDWRFKRSDIDKWIKERTVVAPETEPKNEPRKGNALKPRRKPKPKPSPRRAKKESRRERAGKRRP